MWILITVIVLILCGISKTLFKLVQVLAFGSVAGLGMLFYGTVAFNCFSEYLVTGKDESLGAGVLGVIIAFAVPCFVLVWVATVEGVGNAFFDIINYISRD